MTRHEKYEYDKIQNVAKELDALPKIRRTTKINKTETVNLLINDIVAAKAKGYSIEKISEFLKQKDFNISPSIIRSCLAKHKAKNNRLKPVRNKKNTLDNDGKAIFNDDKIKNKPTNPTNPSPASATKRQPRDNERATGGRFIVPPDIEDI